MMCVLTELLLHLVGAILEGAFEAILTWPFERHMGRTRGHASS
jgi:hypothetical protein